MVDVSGVGLLTFTGCEGGVIEIFRALSEGADCYDAIPEMAVRVDEARRDARGKLIPWCHRVVVRGTGRFKIELPARGRVSTMLPEPIEDWD